jgi:hypothetical protein
MQARGSGNRLVGSQTFTLAQLKSGERNLKIAQIVKFSIKPKVNFMEYIFGGC